MICVNAKGAARDKAKALKEKKLDWLVAKDNGIIGEMRWKHSHIGEQEVDVDQLLEGLDKLSLDEENENRNEYEVQANVRQDMWKSRVKT